MKIKIGYVILITLFVFGCQKRGIEILPQKDSRSSDSSVDTPAKSSSPDLDTDKTDKEVIESDESPLLSGPTVIKESIPSEILKRYIPPPNIKIKELKRPKRVELTLKECYDRALKNSLRIKTEHFSPIISAMDIINAESAFDVVYFLDFGYSDIDQPTVDYGDYQEETTSLSTGFKKHLLTGADVELAYNRYRTKTNLNYYIDPYVDTNFTVEITQPILKGFGIDVNRAEITKAKNTKESAYWRYRQVVRDVLFELEKTYWQLVQARGALAIQKELVNNTRKTLEYLQKREAFDVYKVQITRVQALLGTREAQLIRLKNQVKNMEDKLKSIMNDPTLKLGDDIEIIPLDFPTVGSMVIDHLREINFAIKKRAEIHQLKLAVKNADIDLKVARNNVLPKFDIVFQYTIHGFSDDTGHSFDMITTGDYNDYYIGFEFEYPIGNRGPKALKRKAELIKKQTIARLKETVERIILDVETAIRNLENAYYQLKPALDAVKAADENLFAIVARRIKLSPEYLEVQLNAQATLADAKRTLLNAVVDYNIAVIQLERAKGTLLEFNDIILPPSDTMK